MSRKFNLSFNPRRSSKAVIHIKGSNRHDRFDQDELTAFEKFPKGNLAGATSEACHTLFNNLRR